MTKLEILMNNKDEIINNYKNGETLINLARKFDTSEGYIFKFLHTYCGIEKRNKSKREYRIPKILAMFDDGISTIKISKLLEVSEEFIRNTLKDNGRNSERYSTSPDKLRLVKDSIINDYISGLSTELISQKYDCAARSVNLLLRRNKIPVNDPTYKISFNREFFDNIDTEEKAYILGYFVADGSNHNDFAYICSTDLEVLEKIKVAVEYTSELEKCKKSQPHHKQIYRLNMSSTPMCKRLTELGCPRNKSFVTRFPYKNEVNDDLLRHYLRGLTDGDGCWHITKPGNIQFSIAGTYDLLVGCQEYFTKNNIISYIRPKSSIFTLHVHRFEHIKRIFHLFYDNATIYMERKYQKALVGLANRDYTPYSS